MCSLFSVGCGWVPGAVPQCLPSLLHESGPWRFTAMNRATSTSLLALMPTWQLLPPAQSCHLKGTSTDRRVTKPNNFREAFALFRDSNLLCRTQTLLPSYQFPMSCPRLFMSLQYLEWGTKDLKTVFSLNLSPSKYMHTHTHWEHF